MAEQPDDNRPTRGPIPPVPTGLSPSWEGTRLASGSAPVRLRPGPPMTRWPSGRGTRLQPALAGFDSRSRLNFARVAERHEAPGFQPGYAGSTPATCSAGRVVLVSQPGLISQATPVRHGPCYTSLICPAE